MLRKASSYAGQERSGGLFSTGYIVRHEDGRRGFLKALDYTRALESPDPATALHQLTAAFNFEREVLEACNSRNCSKIVSAIASGRINPANSNIPVQYLIFELAEGDVRKQALRSLRHDLPWFLRAIHHTAVGLSQLHRQDIFHQDLKPSNVLVFSNHDAKVGDLGRARSKGHTSPHDRLHLAGDRGYAPPELLFGQPVSDQFRQSHACDAYHLGSMLYFFVTGASFTPILLGFLKEEHLPGRWGDSFENVLPYLMQSFSLCCQNFRLQLQNQLLPGLDNDWQERLATAMQQLCVPDPALRGHPLNKRMRSGSPYSLERYVSLFNMLAAKAEAVSKSA